MEDEILTEETTPEEVNEVDEEVLEELDDEEAETAVVVEE